MTRTTLPNIENQELLQFTNKTILTTIIDEAKQQQYRKPDKTEELIYVTDPCYTLQTHLYRDEMFAE